MINSLNSGAWLMLQKKKKNYTTLCIGCMYWADSDLAILRYIEKYSFKIMSYKETGHFYSHCKVSD